MKYQYLNICNLRDLLSSNVKSKNSNNIALEKSLKAIDELTGKLREFEKTCSDETIKGLDLIPDAIDSIKSIEYIIKFYKENANLITPFVKNFLQSLENEGHQQAAHVNNIISYRNPNQVQKQEIKNNLHYLKIWHKKIYNILINEYGEELAPEIVKLSEDVYPLDSIVKAVLEKQNLMKQFLYILKNKKITHETIINKLSTIDKSILDEYNKYKNNFTDEKLLSILQLKDATRTFVEMFLKEDNNLRKAIRACMRETDAKIIVQNSTITESLIGYNSEYKTV